MIGRMRIGDIVYTLKSDLSWECDSDTPDALFSLMILNSVFNPARYPYGLTPEHGQPGFAAFHDAVRHYRAIVMVPPQARFFQPAGVIY